MQVTKHYSLNFAAQILVTYYLILVKKKKKKGEN